MDVLPAGFHFQGFPTWKFARHNLQVLRRGPSGLAFSDGLLLAIMDDRVVENCWDLGLVRFGGVCAYRTCPIYLWAAPGPGARLTERAGVGLVSTTPLFPKATCSFGHRDLVRDVSTNIGFDIDPTPTISHHYLPLGGIAL